MDDNTEQPVVELDETYADASNLVVEESVIDEEQYEELMIILDLRRPESQDSWRV